MQARVRKVALPETKLPATHEYRAKPELPEGWTELGAEFGVSRGAVRIQATRGKEEEQ